MPFISRNLTPFGGNTTPIVLGSPETVPGTPQLWAYRTQDDGPTVDTAGYFNAMASVMRPSDWIFRSTINASGVVQSAGIHIVMTVTAAGVVNVSDTLAATITNAD
jgi:hypothetical protein